MTQKISTGLANLLLGGSGITEVFPAFRLRVLDSVPLHADDDQTTVLCELTVDGGGLIDLTFDPSGPVDGVLLKHPDEVWAGTNLAGGECKSWRLVLPADDGLPSTTAPRIQGTIGMSGKDIIVGDPVFNGGETFTLANFYQAYKIG